MAAGITSFQNGAGGLLVDGTQVSVPANSTVNAFSGRPIEFLGAPSVVRLLAVGDAIGLQMQWLINRGGLQLAPIASGTPVNTAAAAGEGPKDDEDTVVAAQPVPGGARSQLNVTNTTAAAINFRYRAVIAG